jgi:hypothetical protein
MIPWWIAILALLSGLTVGCIVTAIFAAHKNCDNHALLYKLWAGEEDKP